MLTLEPCGGLTQLVVLQFDRFVKGMRIGERARGPRDDEYRQREPKEEPELERAAQASFATSHPTPLTFRIASAPSLRLNA